MIGCNYITHTFDRRISFDAPRAEEIVAPGNVTAIFFAIPRWLATLYFAFSINRRMAQLACCAFNHSRRTGRNAGLAICYSFPSSVSLLVSTGNTPPRSILCCQKIALRFIARGAICFIRSFAGLTRTRAFFALSQLSRGYVEANSTLRDANTLGCSLKIPATTNCTRIISRTPRAVWDLASVANVSVRIRLVCRELTLDTGPRQDP